MTVEALSGSSLGLVICLPVESCSWVLAKLPCTLPSWVLARSKKRLVETFMAYSWWSAHLQNGVKQLAGHLQSFGRSLIGLLKADQFGRLIVQIDA